jgi:Mitochondrial ribosomal protein subunit
VGRLIWNATAICTLRLDIVLWMTTRGAAANWQLYADSLLQSLPSTSSKRCQHVSFNEAFKKSRLATLPKITSKPPSYFRRHVQPHPEHQVLTSYWPAHRRGDWGLKRPLPRVNDPHIIIYDLDTQERHTPYTFATEKPRFVRRMRDFGLVLSLPFTKGTQTNYFADERLAKRPRSALAHTHPQWNRCEGGESGPWLVGLDEAKFRRYLRAVRTRRTAIHSLLTQHGLVDGKAERTEDLVQACLDLPFRAPYRTHPTAGLAYSAPGYMSSTSKGVKCDAVTMAGGLRVGRIGAGVQRKRYVAFVAGVTAKLYQTQSAQESYWSDRRIPVGLLPKEASIGHSGRLELVVARFWTPEVRKPDSEATARSSKDV